MSHAKCFNYRLAFNDGDLLSLYSLARAEVVTTIEESDKESVAESVPGNGSPIICISVVDPI